MAIQDVAIKQQKINVLKEEHLVRDEQQSPFAAGAFGFFLQNALYNCSLNLLGEINVWQLYYTIDSNYYCNDRAIQGVVTGFLEMS